MRLLRQGPSLVVSTPAKLNLFLEVCGKRPDGYHELETAMVSIGLCDTLRFSPADEGETLLDVHFPASSKQSSPSTGTLPPPQDNLVYRAAQLLRQETGCPAGVRIDLVKRIPIESGLGGGSSDAAATLVGLNRFWGLGLHVTELHRLAAGLGSDLNFFVDSPRLAICRGRGEQVAAAPLTRSLHFVIVRPPEGLSTAAVFREWSGGGAPQSVDGLLRAIAAGSMAGIGVALFNALERPAATLNSQVRDVLRALRREEVAGCGMSGSGSACFALCYSRLHADRVGRRMRAQGYGRVWTAPACV